MLLDSHTALIPSLESEGRISRAEADDALLRSYARRGRSSAADEDRLARRFMPLARSLALRYRGGREDTEDLFQVADIGLIKALRGWDPDRGVRFPAYAIPTILGELRRHFRDNGGGVHMPRGLQEGIQALSRRTDELTERFGRSPTVAELAESMGREEEEIVELMAASSARRTVSLDAPRTKSFEENGRGSAVLDEVGADEDGYDLIESQWAVEKCVELTSTESDALSLRFRESLSQVEIGARLGVSQMQVSRILRVALGKMLEATQGEEHPDGRITQRPGRDVRYPIERRRRAV